MFNKNLKRIVHKVSVLRRARKINQTIDVTLGDKLRTIAAKIDAVEEYNRKYCNPDKVGTIDAHYSVRTYNKYKNNLKKELLVLLYNY